ncbi:adenosylmethionine--8-amino-7-oxononanoate transaminase [Dokdonia donghaensis]|uniref:Adenosylmethionine-8-amino-7-oxononanoate aminotransferase n=1 Tax=Dokdonia donghaensis DSW-1 TaxID=1300343 RepID=A0A0A2GTW4_9FLAO|nr:adenosylmethionine--8-amino-7-oxononanoate transaminase [Dokdonia donghaensis]ANH59325.1 Adenosylmethionine-8-amino-7-oxononanoate aminotransferase [Dokdonia donghaensis DSW-1]KGO06724.1 adenosylmethionine-8-amino-7-oxononanoate aminotransferase [Dokdonia donghaensis DSW-1]
MTILEKDSKHLWHPLTQHQTAREPIVITRAKGAVMYDDAGNEYIDGIASWYTAMYGHGNEYITSAMHKQMQQLDFVMFSGFTHPPAVTLAEKLVEILPGNQEKVFFNDNGSTAVEAAIKMSLQYYHNKGDKRDTLIAFEDGFHGDTFGAMSASGLSSYNGPFEDFLLKVERIPTPQEDNLEEVMAKLEAILASNKCAAFIFEPLVQGAAGMKFHSVSGLDALVQKCRESNVLTIADEIMTGFGKTGTVFACDQLDNKPDIMCLSKALTAGMFPLSITSCTQEIFEGFLSEEVHKGFFHAHTFSAHPVGCAAAIAGIEVLQTQEITQSRERINAAHRAFVQRVKAHHKVNNVRVKGVIIAIDLTIEMARYGNLRDELYQFFMQRGVALRPLGNTIYVLPPYVITDKELDKVYGAIQEALDHF